MRYVNLKRPSKSDEIKNLIRTSITSNQYKPGDQIPIEEVLSQKFGVGRGTVREAIGSLVHEGLLTRYPRRGTFVTAKAEKLHIQNVVALFLKTKGDVYGKLTAELVRNLQWNSFPAMVTDCHPEWENEGTDLETVKKVINSDPAAIIADGEVYPVLKPYLKEETKSRLIFIFSSLFYACPPPQSASLVIADFKYGGYLAAKHLLNKGHEKILFLSFYVEEEKRTHLDGLEIPGLFILEKMAEGCREACIEKNMSFKDSFQVAYDYHFDHSGKTEALLRDILSSPDRPTAVFACDDIRAAKVINVAAQLGLRISDDLAIVGYYNTSLARSLIVPLTSVSTREEEIARKTVEVVKGDRKEGQRILVKPELVIRKSCGGTEVMEKTMVDG